MPIKFNATCTASIFMQIENCELITFTCKVSPKGLICQGINRDCSVMVELLLTSNEFESFQCNEEFLMGVNFNDIQKVLDYAVKDSKIKFTVEENSNLLELIICNRIGAFELTDSFQFELNPDEKVSFVETTHDYVCELQMLSEKFRNAMKNISDEHVRIIMTNEQILLQSVGDDSSLRSTVAINLSSNDWCYKSPNHVEAVFKKNVLKYLIVDQHLDENIKLKFNHQNVLVAECKVMKFGYLRYYLCPMV